MFLSLSGYVITNIGRVSVVKKGGDDFHNCMFIKLSDLKQSHERTETRSSNSTR